MIQTAKQLEIDRADVDRALTLLKREQKSLALTRAQKISYKLYFVFICGLAICSLAVLGFVTFRRAELWNPSTNLADYPTVVLVFAFGAFVSLIALVFLLFLNLPLFGKILRQMDCLRKMGVSDPAGFLLLAESRKRDYWTFATRLITGGLGLFCLVMAVIRMTQGHWVRGSVILVAGFLFYMFWFLQTGKTWLDGLTAQSSDVLDLRKTMLVAKRATPPTGGERIVVPAGTVEKLAQIESAEIARSRARAICDRDPNPTYSISSSLEVLEAKSKLDPENRLNVEKAIAALMEQPRPVTLREDPNTGLLKQRAEGAEWEIGYTVDDATRRIQLVSLHYAGTAGAGHV